jgi:hypothetical protein
MSYMHNQENSNTKRYYVKNRKKLLPKGTKYVICRSSWEEKFCKWCDNNPNILYWSSEAISIPYYNPIKQKECRYFPDFLIKVVDKDKRIEKNWLVEVKPFKECIPPTKTKNKSKKTQIYEKFTYETNKAKWKAAQQYCKLKGLTFKIITEKELF